MDYSWEIVFLFLYLWLMILVFFFDIRMFEKGKSELKFCDNSYINGKIMLNFGILLELDVVYFFFCV